MTRSIKDVSRGKIQKIADGSGSSVLAVGDKIKAKNREEILNFVWNHNKS